MKNQVKYLSNVSPVGMTESKSEKIHTLLLGSIWSYTAAGDHFSFNKPKAKFNLNKVNRST